MNASKAKKEASGKKVFLNLKFAHAIGFLEIFLSITSSPAGCQAFFLIDSMNNPLIGDINHVT
jgi:hypothetical protein